jgi:hypothetical protein
MLGKVFARFVEKSPISVMVRGTLERVLGADQLDAWFARTAQKQYTRTVLFSTVYDVLSQVVFRIKPSVRAAYRDQEDKVGASLIALYTKRNGVETHTSAELVRYSANVLRSVGRIDTGHVAQQRVQVRDAQGGTHLMLAVVMAALRSVHGAETIDQERSLYDLPTRSPKRITA